MHHRLLYIVTAVLTAGLFVSGAFLIFVQQERIVTASKTLFGTKQDYAKLQLAYEDLKKKEAATTIIISDNGGEKTKEIGKTINAYAAKVSGDISIAYKNLETNESVTLNPDKTYYMASLYKLILTLYVLDKVDHNEASFSDKVGTSSATLDVAIDKIITESNNEYAQTLAGQYGWLAIEQAMKPRLGIDFSFGNDLSISLANEEKLLEEIVSPKRISPQDAEYVLRLMNEQKKTNKLPKYLPPNIYSHNKTGEFNDYSHDAGIFYTPKANYILLFMSKTSDPAATNEDMAQMSKGIYDILNDTATR